jgi:hypothetical protein
MSRTLKVVFLVNAIIWVVLGVLLLAIPGRFLEWLAWSPIDPMISRVLGGAFLALAWGDFRAWRGLTWSEVTVFVEVQLVFSLLASVGLLRHLLKSGFPVQPWILLAIFAIFTVAWLGALLNRQRQPVAA